jgi:hypothetical protein
MPTPIGSPKFVPGLHQFLCKSGFGETAFFVRLQISIGKHGIRMENRLFVGVEIVPQIITQNGGSLARDILRVKIEDKGTSRRTAYRRIDEAEQTGLIKFCKGKNVYIVS